MSRDAAIYEFSSNADISVLVEDINSPKKMALAPDGSIFISDLGGNAGIDGALVWRLDPEGTISPYYIFRNDGYAAPYSMVYGSDGTIYTAINIDRTVPLAAVVAISPSLELRQIATFVGSPHGMAMDSSGNFYVGLSHLSTNRLLKVTPAGAVTTVYENMPGFIWDVESGPDGALYMAVHPSSIYRWHPSSPTSTLALYAAVMQPLSLAFDSDGYLYVGQNLGRVSKVDHSGNASLLAEGFRGDPVMGLAVRPPTPSMLAGLSLSRNEVAGCKTATGTVHLAKAAPTGGLLVTLKDTLLSASTPATLFLPVGATFGTFTIKTAAVSVSETGTVTATLGEETSEKPLKVRPMGLYSLTLSPTSLVGGFPTAGKVTLECKAAPGPVTVNLVSSIPTVANPIASSVVVPQGLSTATFNVVTTPVLSKTSVNIQGTANALSKSRALTVKPAASLSTSSVRFGSVVVGTTSAIMPVWLYNKGQSAFAVHGITLSGTSPKYYAQSSDCPALLAPGASCTIGVSFSPSVTGTKYAKLSVSTSATSAALSVSLSGTGVVP
jgi:hypothetical protein